MKENQIEILEFKSTTKWKIYSPEDLNDRYTNVDRIILQKILARESINVQKELYTVTKWVSFQICKICSEL